MDLITFISGGSLIATILINLFKKWIKTNIEPRWGDLGTQVALLAVSVGLVAVGSLINLLPADFLKAAGGIFIGSGAIYQILWKSIIQKSVLGKFDKDEV